MATYTAPESLHVGTGVETVFGFNWPYQLPSDLQVTLNGMAVPVVLASVNQVAITPAPAPGVVVRILRNTPAQDPKYLFATGIPMLPKYIDGNNKQLLYALQEGLKAFNDTNELAKQAVKDALEAMFNSRAALDSTMRALRVPTYEPVLPTLPNAINRANKVLGFNDLGLPVTTALGAGSAGELAMQLAGSTGASMIGLGPFTLADKVGIWVDVREHGAVDGAADNSVAFQAAANKIAALGGGVLWIPLGLWNKNTRTQLHRNTRIEMDPGAIVRRTGTTDSWMFVNGEVGNLDYAQGYNGDGNLIISGGMYDLNGIPGVRTAAAFVIGHSKRVMFLNITCVNGYNSHNIEINSSVDAAFINCSFYDQTYDSVSQSYEVINVDSANAAGFPGFGTYDLTTCRALLFIGCTFRNVQGGISSHGIAAGAAQHYDIRIIGCVFDGIATRAIRAQGWNDAIIFGNRINNCGNEGITLLLANRCMAWGNIITGTSQAIAGQYSAVRIQGDNNVCGPNIIDNTGFVNLYAYPYGVASGSRNSIDTTGAKFGLSAANGIVGDNGTLTSIDGHTLLFTGDPQPPIQITLADSLNNYTYLVVTTGQVANYTFQTHIVRPYNHRRWGIPPTGGDKFVIQTIGGVIKGDITSLTTINILEDVQHVRQIFGVL